MQLKIIREIDVDLYVRQINYIVNSFVDLTNFFAKMELVIIVFYFFRGLNTLF